MRRRYNRVFNNPLWLLKNFIPFIIESWRYLEQVGLGANRGKFQLEEVWQTNGIEGSAKRIYSWQDNIIHNCDIAVTGHDIEVYSRHFKGKDKITISLETPALLKYNKDFVDRVDFHIFIQNLYRRLSSLSYFYGSKRLELDFNDCIDKARNIEILTEETKWLQWERLSNRQGRKIAMYGLIGEITYSGELDEFIEYLVWGQYTGIGKIRPLGRSLQNQVISLPGGEGEIKEYKVIIKRLNLFLPVMQIKIRQIHRGNRCYRKYSWWYEALIRSLGGSACDPTKTKCNQEAHCVVCELFGCTGWSRKFRLIIERKKKINLYFVLLS